jgi:hypothetical protein
VVKFVGGRQSTRIEDRRNPRPWVERDRTLDAVNDFVGHPNNDRTMRSGAPDAQAMRDQNVRANLSSAVKRITAFEKKAFGTSLGTTAGTWQDRMSEISEKISRHNNPRPRPKPRAPVPRANPMRSGTSSVSMQGNKQKQGYRTNRVF